LRLVRLACNSLKYSEPRFAIAFPPFRPRETAAGSFFFAKVAGRDYPCIMHDLEHSPKQVLGTRDTLSVLHRAWRCGIGHQRLPQARRGG
jgi:hypothetical protein